MTRNHPKRRNDGKPSHGPRKQGGSHGTNGPIWLWGTHAVTAVLANPARTIHDFVATENAARRGPFEKATRATAKEIDQSLPPGAVHQGIAIRVDPLPNTDLTQLIASAPERVCVLDQVTDPHNLGAIYRSAAAFGVTALIMQTRNAPAITGIVAKSAAGATETVKDVRVVNIARALDQLGEAGYHTIGLAGEGRADMATAVRGAAKIAIVLGAEGSGLRPAVAKACAELARIPISPQMESLNVSNAATIAFYEASRDLFAGG